VNESGSLLVKAEKIGKDSTLAHIMDLVEEASRSKSRGRTRRGHIHAMVHRLIAHSGPPFMFYLGMSSREILAVLLVVCADDIAVAVPLSFTAAIARTAKRGVIVKGSAALRTIVALEVHTDRQDRHADQRQA
jgi:cation transport ATPase